MKLNLKINRLLPALLLSCALSAMGEVRPVSLQECVDSAMANNPAVVAATLSVEKARVMKGTAFNPPFTSVTLKQETTGGGGPENGVAFSQDFEFPSIYVARHKALDERTRLESNRLSQLKTEMEAEVAKSYYTLLYCREILAINSRLDSLYASFCHIASVRLAEGEGGPLELMNAERVREKNRLDRQSVEADYQAARLQLQRLTGLEGELTPSETGLEPLSCSRNDFNFSQTAGGRSALGEIAVAEREVAVAKNEFLPEIRLGATVQALIKSFNPYHIERLPFEKGNFMGFEVGISVPLFFGANSSRLKAARLESNIARLNFESADSQASAEVATLNSSLGILDSKLKNFRDVSLPRAAEIQRIAQVSYELGDISYIEYISNIETAFDIYRDYAECVNEYNQTVIALKGLGAD